MLSNKRSISPNPNNNIMNVKLSNKYNRIKTEKLHYLRISAMDFILITH